MNEAERLQLVEAAVEEIRVLARRGAVIIVEGERDIISLKKLGVEGTIVQASGPPLLLMAEEIARVYDVAVVLTDWDEKGEQMAIRIDEYLRSSGLVPNIDIRRRLRCLVQKEIKDVESLAGYVERLREKIEDRKKAL